MNKKLLYFLSFSAMLVILFFAAADFSQAEPITFRNPIESSDFTKLAAEVLSYLRNIIAVLAIIFIVIGGIMYMISGGNQGMMEKGRKTITAALIGLVIALSANTFLVEIWEILNVSAPGMASPSGPALKDIAINVLNFLLSIVGVLAMISMVVGGFMMIASYGNQERVEKGKKILTYSIVGVIISLSALIIVRQVSKLIFGY